MNWHLQADNLESPSFLYLLNSLLIGCCSSYLTFIPILPLICVNSHRPSVLTDSQFIAHRWTQSKTSYHIYQFDRLQQSMTIS